MTVQKPTENDQSSISNHNKNRIKSLLLYCASFVALTTIYYYFSTLFSLNSDRASILLEAKDILNGNFFLDGWYLSTVPFYFTETLPLAFLSLLFGSKSFLLHLMPALYYSLVVLLSFNLMRKKNKSCTPFIGLMLIPSPFFASNSITACVHIGAIIVGLVIINSYTKINSPITKIMLSLITGLALYSDNLLLYFLIIPIIMATTISILKKRRIDEFVHAIIPIGSVLFSKIINLYFSSINSFVMPITEPPHFATLEQFGFNLKLMIEALLKLFGADILEGSVTDTTTIMALINIIIIPCFFIIAIKAIKTNNTFEFVDYILLSSSVMLPAAFLASNIPSDMGSSRYLIPPIISFVIFIGRNAKMPTQKHQLLTVVAIIFCGINCYKFSKSNNYDTSHLVAEYLKNNNFSEGFANYWRASSSSVIMDNGNTVIAPVNVNTIDGKIYAYKWLSNSKWFDLQSRYIILNSDEQLHALTRKFGDDAYIKKINDTYIVIYKDKRLSITG